MIFRGCLGISMRGRYFEGWVWDGDCVYGYVWEVIRIFEVIFAEVNE